LRQVGFAVEDILEFNRISSPGWYISGKLLKKQEISPIQLRAFDSLVWLWRKVDRFLPWEPTSIIAIAVKPGTTASMTER
jgi:hypothetical protein